jgi:PIN domain nuclease of toxin-antitoxin system
MDYQMDSYVVDTHAIAWFIAEDKRLSFQAMLTLPKEWDIHDRIIGATASYYQTTLITRDEMLRASTKIQTLWD